MTQSGTGQSSAVKLDPPRSYVAFSHRGPVSNIRDTIDAVHKWFLTSGFSGAQAGHDLPVMLERYGERFDPQTGSGDIEIWTPIKE
jgi:AraC family transcriptional regulator